MRTASWNHVEGNLIKIKAIILLAVPPPVNNSKSDGADFIDFVERRNLPRALFIF